VPAEARYTKEMAHRDTPEGMSMLQEIARTRDLSAAATLRQLVREEHRRHTQRTARKEPQE
jgi:hypothetical protein